jgi:glycosyltransferase involved in cell wall biosynthesis
MIAAMPPLVCGAAPFNSALVRSLRTHGDVDVISWRRHYPPLLQSRQAGRATSPAQTGTTEDFLLDWCDRRTWRAAVARIALSASVAVVLPWLHPVMAPPYSWLLRHVPKGTARVVICHNVDTHERVPFGRALTRSVLRRADLLVTHAPHQTGELEALGLAHLPRLEAFHPHFETAALAPLPGRDVLERERARLGDGRPVLLCFGAVRPYKGVDLAFEALALLPPRSVKLVVAGRFWSGTRDYELLAKRLGVDGDVELIDEYVSDERAALLFGSCDACLLPYRSASQSGVAALSLAYARPVIATAVGGLPAAVRDGVDGILCPPGSPAALAAAIEQFIRRRETLVAGAQSSSGTRTFEQYAELLRGSLAGP